ncbi:MAG TPA: hypothetical protein DEB06_06145 [Phycisphaerales bacterium]|nr:hypothetical protein [Phycisphaerales bacterium]
MRSGWVHAALGAASALIGLGHLPARAGVRETRTLAGVESVDRKGDADNDTRTFTLTGGYTLGAVHIIGEWTNPNGVATKPGHCYARVRRPDGAFVDVRLAYTSAFVANGTTLINADFRMSGADPAGQWQLEFYESVDDAPGLADMVWNSLRFEFEDTSGGTNGGDITLCEVYGLEQRAREFDVAGLSLGTTSWNIGSRAMAWRSAPDVRHPFIAMNIYRLRDGRFTQIGQSWVKHGFFALSDAQCGGFCNATSGEFLGVGCTDTYTPSVNANQSGLGPRFEVNPWTGAWDFNGSILQTGIPGGDTPTSRLIRVRDADLDPALNDGAEYFYEAFYIARDDANPLNSAAWKPFGVLGQTAGVWAFDQPARSTAPLPGFAIQGASPTAQVTTLAQFFPVSRGFAPDGRCFLSSEAIDNKDGTWRYEYALMNVDMARQVGAFDIPAAFGIAISDIGFSAPEHDREFLNQPVAGGGGPIDNDPWGAERTAEGVRWKTGANPLRWGTVYSFWFTANAPPTSGTVTLQLFTPGAITEVQGAAQAPAPKARCTGDTNSDSTVDFDDIVAVLQNWRTIGPFGDATQDGDVDFDDISAVLVNWLQPCP